MSRLVAAYPSSLVIRPGETLSIHAHADVECACTVDLVRVVQGDRAFPLELPVVSASFPGQMMLGPQPISAGSSAEVRPTQPVALESWSLGLALMPTRRAAAGSGVLALQDAAGGATVRLELSEHGHTRLTARSDSGLIELELELRLPLHRWSLVTATWDADVGEMRLGARIVGQGVADHRGARDASRAASLSAHQVASLVLGCNGQGASFDGKIDAVRILSRAVAREALEEIILSAEPTEPALVGAIDFAAGMGTAEVFGRGGPGWRGRTHNQPSRAVRGVRWDASEHDWRKATDQYSAAHLHSDDIYDIGWAQSFAWTAPADLRSGAYAVRITDPEGGRAYATFFVEPASACTDVVFLASTATYLAYANETVFLRLPEMLYGVKPKPPDEYMPLINHSEFGGSLYEHHADGSGVRTSSWLRPIVNLRPETRMWSFNADTAVTAWLERVAPGYDTVTDHGLHSRGVGALDGARVVVTGTHPEYVSDEMLDALEAFLARGGRLIYMGGNGFYWRTAFNAQYPAAIEIRRAEDGTRAWIETPGEYHHEFDGRLGVLWRRCGRPPNRLVGVGFAAQGFVSAAGYRRKPAADDPRAAFVMRGVEGDMVGAHGAWGGGAASEEIDRFDAALGSPPHALVLASSEGHGPDMLKVKEEFFSTMPVLQDANVRADLTFFETPVGGAVFSTGSIGWAGALGTKNYINDVARISANVLARFRDATPFEWPGEEGA